jgi:1-acyl-sn-glycerol-3-phosphate acyltransferase
MGYLVLAKAALETARISVPTIVDDLLGRVDFGVCDRRLDGWSRRLLEQAGIELVVTGRQYVDATVSYVVMSNHQSHYDIPVMFQALGLPLRMVAKAELFKIPIMGPAMRHSGFIEIDRKNRRRAVEQLAEAQERLENHSLSVWIAPEGTRSKDGKLGSFKLGGFHLAVMAKAPILPVTILGTYGVHRSGDNRVHRGQRVVVRVHQPIPLSEYETIDIKELRDRVRQTIASDIVEGVSE